MSVSFCCVDGSLFCLFAGGGGVDQLGLVLAQAKSMSTRAPHEPEENVWAEMTFDY